MGEGERTPPLGTSVERTVAALVKRLDSISGRRTGIELGELQRPGDGRCIYTLERRGHVLVRSVSRGDFLDALEAFEAGFMAYFDEVREPAPADEARARRDEHRAKRLALDDLNANRFKKVAALKPDEARLAPTTVTTFDGGDFIRTALVIGPGPTGSIDLVDASGARIAQVNVTLYADGRLILDTIDVEKHFVNATAFLFANGRRHFNVDNASGALVSADFKRKP